MRQKRKRRGHWSNRLAIIGITTVVISLALVVNLRNTSLKARDLEYRLREESLDKQLKAEEARLEKLEEYRIYIDTKQYIEQVAKEKLGLVKPDEILLKPESKN